MRVVAAIAGNDMAHGAPVRAVIGVVDGVARSKGVRRPVQDQAAEFARPLEIQRQRLPIARAMFAAPDGSKRSVERVGGLCRRQRRARLHFRRHAFRRSDRQRAQCELVEAHRSLAAALPFHDHQFERSTVPERVILRRPPGKSEVSPLEAQALPLTGKREVRTIDPPDVFPVRIQQLEL
ncbi:hypothetical protein D3C83_01610 [compost metagenome]